MHFIVTGSGGCTSLPLPCCQCPVCEEARTKGVPYLRCGCSLWLEEASLLVDTPEDIAHALNHSRIPAVNSLLYSHWDPDHTMGLRVLEQLRLNWFDVAEGRECENPIRLYALSGVLHDLQRVRSPLGPYLDYYEKTRRLVTPHEVTEGGTVCFGDISVHFIPVTDVSGPPGDSGVTVFVFEQGGKRLVYAPCDCLPFPEDERLHGADVLLIGNTAVGDALKGGVTNTPDCHPKLNLYLMDDIMSLKQRLGIPRVIVTHLEELWGKSYDDYKRLEPIYGVEFAYDTMQITV